MTLDETPEDAAFRAEIRGWLAAELPAFENIRFRGGPGDEDAMVEERRRWEQHLGASGWSCVGWPKEHGGRGLSLVQQVIYHEEYARAGGPGRLGHIGETLLGPTLIAFGTPEQQRRFLPGIVAGTEYWCQGYSEPNAGSDLANVQTRAELVGDQWVLHGQKVWTSHAHTSDWCFVIARTDAERPRHQGLSYLLVPMRQPGVEIRPIVQLTRTSEFNEVFFDGARTEASLVVGGLNQGWKVAMGTLAFERGVSTLGQQLSFQTEFEAVLEAARRTGSGQDPLIRQRLARAWVELQIMRLNALRVLGAAQGGELPREALFTKLYWSEWHKALGELAMDVLGDEAEELAAAPYALTPLQRLFLFSRADTIYAGSSEIQRNIIAERALGLPREPDGQGTRSSAAAGAPKAR